MPNDDAKADPDITLTDELDPADFAVIADGLSAYDFSQIGYRDFRRLSVVVRDPQTGKVVGGLYGRSSLGLVYIDCPVTGLPQAAAAGKLTLLVGADAADLDSARPYLAPIGDVVRHFGAVGTGTVFKLINNLMGAVQIASLAEGVAMAEQAGLDMNLVAEALATGAVASPQVIRHSKRMVARDFSGASFTSALRHKDAAYAVKLAESLLANAPLVGRAAVEAYARSKAEMPDDDEGKMIEIVSRPK